MSDTNIDYRHPAYDEFKEEWQLVGDCVDGQRRIKRNGTKYLPHPSTDFQNDDPLNVRYNAYKARAPFINATGRTLMGLLGIAFSKPVKIELTGRVAELETDADGEGQPLTQMIRDALSQNLQRGRAGILTDYSGTGEQTVATAGRPLLRLFTAKQIINWRVTAGKTSLVVIHYEEPIDSPDSFELIMGKHWIELRLINGLAHSRHWVQGTDEITAPGYVALTDSAGTQLDELPWAWIGASNNDHTPDSPPLADIAYVNIAHYNAEADIAEASHTVGQPMVAVTGLDEQWADRYLADGLKVGSQKGVLLPTGGDIKYVQPEERNIMIQLAERRENQMAMLGAKLVERNTSARTATQAGDEAQTDNSILSLCAGNVEQAVNRALTFAIRFAGAGEANIELNKRYELANLDSQAITALVAAVQSGKMRLADFIRYQQRVGLVDEKEKPDEIEDELRNQQPELITGGGDDDKQPPA